MIAFQSCDALPIPILHQAMVSAFSDYLVSMSPTLQQFAFMLRQRGYDPSLSQVAVKDGRPVAFWIIGSDPKGSVGAYVIATGTTPEFRRHGLATQAFTHVRAALSKGRVAGLELEVIDKNTGARDLYERLGFELERTVTCFTVSHSPEASGSIQPAGAVIEVPFSELQNHGPHMRDWPPSWQNEFDCLARVSDSLICLGIKEAGDLSGYGILIPLTETVAQIAVAPNQRRRGVGTRLLAALFRANGSRPMRIINADADDRGFSSFVEYCKGAEGTRQFVMRLPI